MLNSFLIVFSKINYCCLLSYLAAAAAVAALVPAVVGWTHLGCEKSKSQGEMPKKVSCFRSL